VAINVCWQGNMNFIGKDASGHEVAMDASEVYGGTDQGVRPMDLLLMSVAGCSAVELKHIMNKMRMEIETFTIEVAGDRAEEHPKVFKNIRIVFKINGSNLVPNKIIHALKLTDETYCSVSNTVGKVAKVTYELVINGERYEYVA